VQFDPHAPEHCDCPAQLEVHPVPQFTLHVFFDEQLSETLLGAPASEEPLSEPGPREQVPPDWHVHVVPLHEQEPLHSSGEVDAPEHDTRRTTRAAGNHTRLSMP